MKVERIYGHLSLFNNKKNTRKKMKIFIDINGKERKREE